MPMPQDTLYDQDLQLLVGGAPDLPLTRAALELIEWRRAARSFGCADPAFLWRLLEQMRAGEVEALARKIYLHRGLSMHESFIEAEKLVKLGDEHAAARLSTSPSPR